MPEFKDAKGQSWLVELDGITLAELRERAQIDIVQDGLYFVEEREDVLLRALLMLCREQIDERKLTDRQFARLITGSTLETALNAVRGAAELFFLPSRWSELLSRSENRRTTEETYRTIKPLLAILNQPDMPPTFRETVMAALQAKIEEATNSATSDNPESASGLTASQRSAVGSYLASLESTPAA